MSIDITMPALSPTMESGKLAKWVVSEGDSVAPGDVIAEIETDKATMEVEAVDEGTIAKILVAEGSEDVKVNAVIAILAEEGEDASSVEAKPAASTPETKVISVEEPTAMPTSEGVNATPLAKKIAEQNGVNLSTVSGTGSRGKIMADDVTSNGTQESRAPANSGDRRFISPLARKMAEDAGLDISTLPQGSGPNGRVIAEDVDAFIASGGAKAMASASSSASKSAAKSTMASGMSDDAVLGFYTEGEYEVKPHDGMRRVIAERLTESAQTIPSYTINMACQLDALLALRAEINAAAPIVDERPTYKISVNDFIIKALAIALQRVPMANASWTSDARIIHKHSDVGVAVAVPDGLFTPIVRQAELKSLTQISAEVKDMAGRAKSKKLAPQEYQGGSTAVSNLGMFGVDNFTSIINPPHASIVSIGAGEKKPVVINDEIKVATVMNATFAFDHRVIDGALGAQLGVAFKTLIEKPAGMLV